MIMHTDVSTMEETEMELHDINDIKSTHEETTVASNEDGNEGSGQDEKFRLKRQIGLWGSVSFFAGTMIGSGIFVTPQTVLLSANSVGLTLTIWALCGVIALAGALTYAEMSLVLKKSGGNYIILLMVYGPKVAFMRMMLGAFMTGPSSGSVSMMACAQYLLVLFFQDGCELPPDILVKITAVMVLISISTMNFLSIKFARDAQVVCMFAKLTSLFIICGGGLIRLAQGQTENFKNAFEGSNTNIGEISLAFYGGMWAYDGWQMMIFFLEEIENPERNVPLSAFISVTLVTFVNILANVSYFTVMSTEQLIASPAVVQTWADVVIPQFAWIMPLFVAVSVYGSANGHAFSNSRAIYSPAREGHFPKILAMINVHRYTPASAIIFYTITGITFIIIGDNVTELINWFSFSAWFIHGLVMVAGIYMRYAKEWKDKPRPFKAPLICFIFLLCISIYFVMAPIIAEPEWGYLYAFGLMGLALVLYFPLIQYKVHIPGYDYFNKNAQLFLNLAPEEL